MDVMVLVALVVGLAVGAAFGLMRGKQALAGAVARAEFDRVVGEKTTLLADFKNAQTRMSDLNGQLDNVSRELTEARERLHEVRAAKEMQEKLLQKKDEEMVAGQELLKLQFKEMSAAMLEQMGQKFTTQSEEKLGVLLNPMRERLVEFSELVTKSFSEHSKEQHTLKDVIGKIVLQTDGLTKALRGDVKAQGNWGEIMLERILEASGLEKGVGYTTQGTDMGLMDEQGNRKRPDVIVHLPDGKHIIIDSKVSLTSYERYCEPTDEAAKAMHLKDFIRSINAHVTGLSAQKYQNLKGLEAPDFVLLFMPIEGAFSLAVQQDASLHSNAWDKRIAIVSPSTLFISLKTVASLWAIDNQNKNTAEIAQRGAALYDKFAGFIDDMGSIKKALDATNSRFDSAMGKLSTGQGNLLRQAEMMKQLGLKTTKSLPKELLDQVEENNLIAADV